MYILGADTDDLIQEGMIGLFKAIRDYDFGRDAGFSTFANLCVTRQIYTAVEASGPILSAVRPASESAFLQGSFVLSYNSSVICSN